MLQFPEVFFNDVIKQNTNSTSQIQEDTQCDVGPVVGHSALWVSWAVTFTTAQLHHGFSANDDRYQVSATNATFYSGPNLLQSFPVIQEAISKAATEPQTCQQMELLAAWPRVQITAPVVSTVTVEQGQADNGASVLAPPVPGGVGTVGAPVGGGQRTKRVGLTTPGIGLSLIHI